MKNRSLIISILTITVLTGCNNNNTASIDNVNSAISAECGTEALRVARDITELPKIGSNLPQEEVDRINRHYRVRLNVNFEQYYEQCLSWNGWEGSL